MPPKASSSAGDADSVALPLDAFFELRAFQDQLLSAAHTLDPATSPCPSLRKPEQARHRALASVFRVWADQIDHSLGAVRSP
ncbi:XAC0095 family protein [Lysobacter sp. TAB13]|uniref:XAC0095 family protein n=1 Tax=Lysobacter sp. TAB13 TaxID=3233065 RepID=UPI003F950826